ncbi:MAG: bromoperoxidase [Pseudomonadota bacterium]
MLDPADYEAFQAGTIDPDPTTFAVVPLNKDLTLISAIPPAGMNPADHFREWESPTAGLAFVLQGPDPLAVGIPPAPRAGSAELAAEMGEVYQMALHRDLPVAAFMDATLVAAMTSAKKTGKKLSAKVGSALQADHEQVAVDAGRLSGMRWFRGITTTLDEGDPLLRARRRCGQPQAAGTLYRGSGEDPWPTPFVSQFLVMGTGPDRSSGIITYGAQRIDQKVRVAEPGRDYMTSWQDWSDVQNAWQARIALRLASAGNDTGGADKPWPEFVTTGGAIAFRPITTLRDLATYVHDDQLYQAYLNAALILLGERAPVDPGIPYHRNARLAGDNREPFAMFGGPHLLTLVTEVSSRALRAVRATKFSVHRRLRPEAMGALFHTVLWGYDPAGEGAFDFGHPVQGPARRSLGNLIAPYLLPQGYEHEPVLQEILTEIRHHNEHLNKTDAGDNPRNSWLLPMAFPEGSPMHPAYGAGHATVAGACVTVLKAFFDMGTPDHRTMLVEPGGAALIAHKTRDNDPEPDLIEVPIDQGLTVLSELNKLAWNISNARNIAGVHYYTDYIESALLGEAVAIGILREQMLTYWNGRHYSDEGKATETPGEAVPSEAVSMDVPLFAPRTLPAALLDGADFGPGDTVAEIRIREDGSLSKLR